MKAAVDLHIHSALSPCSDKDMTPNNIVNMSIMKGLDFIAVTDHNSVENVKAVMTCAKGKDLIVVPGMELETSEEVHVVCLFPDIEAMNKMQHMVYNALPDIKNREDIFGEQLILNVNDEVVGRFDRLLLTATSLSLNNVSKAMSDIGGVMIPAHIDRESYSILSNLGTIPENLDLKYLEISRCCELSKLKNKLLSPENFCFIKSSDAHNLGSILERESFLEIGDKSIKSLLNELR